MHELAADDGTGGVGSGGLEGGLVADAETYQTGIAQVHGVDATEIGLLLLVEALLCACRGCARHHVDKSAGVCVNQTDTLLGGLRRDQHNHFQIIPIGDRFVVGHVVGIGQIRNDHAIHTYLHAALAEGFEAILHNGIQVTHQDNGDLHALSNPFQLLEEQTDRHAVAQRLCARLLNDRTIGHWVGKGNTYLNHVDTFCLQLSQDLGCIFQPGIAGGEIDGENAVFLCLE